jgi:translation initiation factor IF-3
VPEVRLIGDDGNQIGVLKTPEALAYAQERDLDLVEVAADARPPVCRVLDYSKYKYEQEQKLKAARKHQQQITVREIKFRPKIAQHDYNTKKGHVVRFLRHQDKVKVTIMFRGREMAHPERGQMILERLAEELAELAVVEQRPLQDGRNMTMMLAPSKLLEKEAADEAAVATATEDAPADVAEATAEVEDAPAEAEAEAPAPAEKPA